MSWTTDNIPDQSGRVAIVTGSNTGIGFETAKALALKGAKVILACRTPAKGLDAVQRIQAENPTGEVLFEQLDLSDLDNVRAFGERLNAAGGPIDLLILNAGVMVPPESKTAQGFELQFGVNHLGHFALTGHMLPLLTDAGRVVVVSSTAANMGEMNFEDLNFESRGYKPWPAYGQSKLANQLFVTELQRQLQAAGKTQKVTAAHPGWTATDLQRTSGMASFLNPILAMKPSKGALPTLRAATDPDAEQAAYFGPDGLMQMRGYPKQVPLLPKGKDPATARKLWQVSEQLTHVRYGLV
ncbi:MAG: NAD(P)-dependent dehydrogenase (short-subunit alcohol dehydrogenase family) [Cognaticolwellia sp.]|jgi:NAD(P)-dependent dehydrogenase (short-subunit alcohol dehydrogenase family)